MDRETPSSSSFSLSSQTSFNYQQNQPVTYTPSYYNKGFNIHQIPENNTNNYYNGPAIKNPYLFNNANGHYNNGYMTLANVPRANRTVVPLTKPVISSLNHNNYLKSPPPSYDLYNSTHTSQVTNDNEYFINGSLPNTSNTNFNNESMHSLSNNMCFNTPTVPPLHIKSPQTIIDKPLVNCFKKQYGVSRGKNETRKEPQKRDKWFNSTSKSFNNLSNNTSKHNHSRRTSNRFQFSNHRSDRRSQKRSVETNKNVFAEIKKLSSMTVQQIIDYEKKKCFKLAPTNIYYKKQENSKTVFGKESISDTCDEFNRVLGKRTLEMNAHKPTCNMPYKNNVKINKNKYSEIITVKVLNRKMAHPDRLHPELRHNESGEMNDSPLCKCSVELQQSGIRHNIYVGEGPFVPCLPNSNNADKLFHYRVIITPPTNFLFERPTVIEKDGKKFVFEGFSLLSHYRIPTLPNCKLIRFNTNYTILYIEDKIPENFVVNELQLFYDYLFKDILELIDLDLHAFGNKDGCPQFHFLPRFVREVSGFNKEILSMNDVLKYLLTNNKLLFEEDSLAALENMSMGKWQNIVDEYRGMIVTNPRKKPYSIRVDQLDKDNVNRTCEQNKNYEYPVLVHFGNQPSHLSNARNPDYLEVHGDHVKSKYLSANTPKASFKEEKKLKIKEKSLQEIKPHSKQGVTAEVSSKGFYKTGLMCDIVQHAMILPVLVRHLRFHKSLEYLEDTLNYKFKNRYLLQLAFTHSSYQEHFGTNHEHARNTLSNCGMRNPKYGNKRINPTCTKKGLNTLINTMSRFGKKIETESKIMQNERLEFLGDTVVEFVSTIHLFHTFPDIEVTNLSVFRTAIVENNHLAFLAKTLKLDDYLLYAHDIFTCHDSEFHHAMADCFEALMGALYLDGGINIADRVFGEILFKDSPEHLDIWVNYPKHPFQKQEPEGDRKRIETSPFLKILTKFEDSTGIKFNHIRLLANAFTNRSVAFRNLTLGSNQRLKFLGTTVCKFIVSDYLYKFFPDHHEGHLSLLRNSLVNYNTKSAICDDLDMDNYAYKANEKEELTTKAKAHLLEAFLGALYIDKGLRHCEEFCNVCVFPRLTDFILKKDWNDPKSKLQQYCLTVRSNNDSQPDLPVYKEIKRTSSSNKRKYTVAVYFKGVKLAQGNHRNIHNAEMNAAKNALKVCMENF